MNRKIYYWKLRGSEMQLGERTLIMAVLNITPDSFSDGGRFNDPDRAYARALELEEQGADIIDIGAESTKPGSHRISMDEEWQRLVPVLKRLRGNLRVPLSLDTYKSQIAERALEYGVEIFNDPTGLTFDPGLARVAAQGDAGLILNHMRGEPGTWAKLPPMQDPIGSIARDLEATVNRARGAGVDRARIVVDPGLGFGKRKEQNAVILAHLKEFAGLDYPILVGPSRKSFLAQSSESETLYATAAAVAVCVLHGAHIVRVHDVREMHTVVQVAEEIARASVAQTTPREEERSVARPRSKTGPEFEAERPHPPRPPISKPVVEQTIAAAAATPEPRVEAGPEPGREQRPAARQDFTRKQDFPRKQDFTRSKERRDERPARAPFPNREPRDGSRPPLSRKPADRGAAPRDRNFRPGQGDRFKPAAPSRPFNRDAERGEGRPPRPINRDDRNRDEGKRDRPVRDQARPPYSKPSPREGSQTGRPPSREFRPGSPRSGPPRPPKRDDERFRPAGPKRTFDRGGDSRRQDRPAGPPSRGSGPPKRPFRKRP